jgi:hypothetical protein
MGAWDWNFKAGKIAWNDQQSLLLGIGAGRC